MVTTADAARAVGSPEQRLYLIRVEEADVVYLPTLLGDGQHPLDAGGVFGVRQGRKAEQRVDGSQPDVPAAHAQAPFSFQVVKEAPD